MVEQKLDICPNVSVQPVIGLVSAEDVKDKKGAVKVKPFKKYFDGAERVGLTKWVKDNFDKRSDKTIIVKVSDVIKEMGPEFENLSPLTVYQALKYVLFQDGIMTSLGFHRDGSRVFVMREKKPGEKLAASYKYWEDKANKREQSKDARDVNIINRLNAKRQQITQEKADAREAIRKERDAMHEELRKERNRLYSDLKKEKKVLTDQIKKLKEILEEKTKNRTYMVEIFKINWKTLEWKLIKGKTVKTEGGLIELIKEYASTTSMPSIRHRIEVTEIDSSPEIGDSPKIEIVTTENTGEKYVTDKVGDTLLDEHINYIIQEKIDGACTQATDIHTENIN